MDVDPSFKGPINCLWQAPEVLAAGATSTKRAMIYEYV
jgi:hypothetical protein